MEEDMKKIFGKEFSYLKRLSLVQLVYCCRYKLFAEEDYDGMVCSEPISDGAVSRRESVGNAAQCGEHVSEHCDACSFTRL